jgi:hypothetical protein
MLPPQYVIVFRMGSDPNPSEIVAALDRQCAIVQSNSN